MLSRLDAPSARVRSPLRGIAHGAKSCRGRTAENRSRRCSRPRDVLVAVGRGAKHFKFFSCSCKVVGFQSLNHNKQKCKVFPNNNHDVPSTFWRGGIWSPIPQILFPSEASHKKGTWNHEWNSSGRNYPAIEFVKG